MKIIQLLAIIFLTGFYCIYAHVTRPVIVLDVDGTLYESFAGENDCLVETQIRDNCHIFSSKFGYNDEQCMHMI